MDVVNPEIEEINGIPYRINVCNDCNFSKQTDCISYIEHGEEDEVACGGETFDEDNDLNDNVEQLVDGKFRIHYHVAKPYYPYIIGRRGGTKQRLEQETQTVIHIPRQNEDGDITITGSTRDQVASTYRRIKIMVLTCRARQPKTHFISIPLNQSQFIQNYLRFKNLVLEKCCNQGITADIFQSPEKLHQTIGVLVLSDNVERSIAVDTLMDSKKLIVNPIMKNRSLKIRIRGIDIMNDDPTSVNVLYASIEENSSYHFLQQLVDQLADFFNTTDLMVNHRGRVKLHISIMNTQFLKPEKIDDKFVRPKKSTFDASQILKEFNGYDFGEAEVNSIHLSQMHTVGKDGYYLATCKMTVF